MLQLAAGRARARRAEPPPAGPGLPAGPLTCPAPSRRSASRTASCPRRSPWRPSPHPPPRRRGTARRAAPTRSLRLHSPPFPRTGTGLSAAILGPGNNPAPHSPPEAAQRLRPTRSESAAGWVRLGQSQRGRRVGRVLGTAPAAVAARSAPPVTEAAAGLARLGRPTWAGQRGGEKAAGSGRARRREPRPGPVAAV